LDAGIPARTVRAHQTEADMNTITLTRTTRGFTLKQLLGFDALTCLAFGLVLVAASATLTPLLGLPSPLLSWAGIALFPCAGLMLLAARTLSKPLVALVVAGNFAWAAGSVAVALAFETTVFGLVFMLAQALLVAALGVLEMRASR
jgi:hypothetical protein